MTDDTIPRAEHERAVRDAERLAYVNGWDDSTLSDRAPLTLGAQRDRRYPPIPPRFTVTLRSEEWEYVPHEVATLPWVFGGVRFVFPALGDGAGTPTTAEVAVCLDVMRRYDDAHGRGT